MDVFLFDAVRTPRGKGRPGGSLAAIPPVELVVQLVAALEARLGAEAVRACGHFALGCVTEVGVQGGHIALTSRIRAGLPETLPCQTLNNFCVSGLSAIAQSARRIALGEVGLAMAGGVESMSQVEFLADGADYYSDMRLARSLGWAPVGLAADLMAAREGIERAALDAVTLRSHHRARAAWAAGRFEASVIPVHSLDGTVALGADENVRDLGDGSGLATMRLAFDGVGAAGFDEIILEQRPELGGLPHVHTLAHCPPIADGAGLVLLGSAEAGQAAGLRPVARILAMAETADDHVLQLTAGFSALEQALSRAKLSLSDMGAIEFMEAFAATIAKFDRDYGADPDRVNVNGGHLAMGHPMGASGAILAGTLLDAMRRLDAELGVVAATGGVGVGAAMVLERV
ncbi:acetyl-CoA C-acyltransferase [Phenylobacterium montanum]|uniref:Acetyl-CoA C-acyltransferase n=1 Tax=Phenylobacterium montanum TaxID=2823693 RepID=A0A975G2N7_9CAUL|nr:acetyl-CoA C-acyltransferase [Caulobacter sp. S6]QUD89484.1 acetyl-CoA C-acyltransferase [Caulobacter sp. S6]